jgi:hypothetical protein
MEAKALPILTGMFTEKLKTLPKPEPVSLILMMPAATESAKM